MTVDKSYMTLYLPTEHELMTGFSYETTKYKLRIIVNM